MQATGIGKTVQVSGIGLHSGVETQVTLTAGEPGQTGGQGIVFRRVDVPAGTGDFRIREHGAALVKAQPMATVLLNNEGTSLSTVEHLMAALAGLGVTDVLVEVDGPELPILDGSALPWVELLDEAGRVSLAETVAPQRVAAPVLLDEKGRRLEALPVDNNDCRLEVAIDFPHPLVGAQRFGGVLTEAWFRSEIAPARTFAVEKDLKTAMAWGLAKGARLEGGVLFTDDGDLANPEGLRFPDEPVRHKVLDAIGDLYMTGRPWAGAFSLTTPGHAVTNALLRKLVNG